MSSLAIRPTTTWDSRSLVVQAPAVCKGSSCLNDGCVMWCSLRWQRWTSCNYHNWRKRIGHWYWNYCWEYGVWQATIRYTGPLAIKIEGNETQLELEWLAEIQGQFANKKLCRYPWSLVTALQLADEWQTKYHSTPTDNKVACPDWKTCWLCRPASDLVKCVKLASPANDHTVIAQD